MKKIPKVYCASLATETNTFSPLKTNMKSFKETFFAKPYLIPKHQLYALPSFHYYEKEKLMVKLN